MPNYATRCRARLCLIVLVSAGTLLAVANCARRVERGGAPGQALSEREVRAEIGKFLSDPDLPAGIIVTRVRLSAAPDGSRQWWTDIALGSSPRGKQGSVFVDAKSGDISFGIILDPPPVLGTRLSAKQALDIARRFCKRNSPELWARSSGVEEVVNDFGRRTYVCDFGFVKTGFRGYAHAGIEVSCWSGKVVDWGASRVLLEPPTPKITEEEAEKVARPAAASALHVGADSLQFDSVPDKRIMGGLQLPGPHAAYNFNFADPRHIKKDVRFPPGYGPHYLAQYANVGVDVVTGQVATLQTTWGRYEKRGR